MNLKELNKQRWDNCRISADNGPRFKSVADRILLYKSRYQAVEKSTGVPWWFIGVTHYRESNLDFNTYLGNGQVLSKKTTIVPKGRGPFVSWEEGAVDALTNCAPYAAKNKDWSIGSSLELLEKYNGLGYANKGIPSPYLWAGTNQYVRGKYIADGKFSSTTVDKQLGCAGILKFLGVFKSTPTGVASAVAAGGAGAATVAAATVENQSWWNWATDHWFLLLLGIAGTAFLVDLALSIYNNEKNALKADDPDVG